ncbi:MAG: hypothetical protein ROZ64_18260 [Burkholderiaceae bacterium]|jgi:alkylated DNA nucleotide flippase Atl1|nr:hypothetical protein [Burkholderiaceae bacterium]
MRKRPAQWFDPIAPVAQPRESDPCERAELVLQAIDLLRRSDNAGARHVAAGLSSWLSEGGDLARLLGLRVRRGRRAVGTILRARERDAALREAAVLMQATPARLALEVRSDSPIGRRLREIGAPMSERQIARILARDESNSDTSS